MPRPKLENPRAERKVFVPLSGSGRRYMYRNRGGSGLHARTIHRSHYEAWIVRAAGASSHVTSLDVLAIAATPRQQHSSYTTRSSPIGKRLRVARGRLARTLEHRLRRPRMGKVPRKRRSSPSLRRAVHSFLELNLAEVLRDAGRTMREAPPQPREEQSSRRVDAYILLAAIASISCAPVSPTPAGRPKTSAASAAVPAEFAHPRQTVVSRPAVLFASPTGTVGAGVDLQYLRELHDKGF